MRLTINEDEYMNDTVEMLESLGIIIQDIYKVKSSKKDIYEAKITRFKESFIVYKVKSSKEDIYEAPTRSKAPFTGRGETPAKALENAVNNIICKEFN